MIARDDFIWRWVNRSGLYLKHKDLRPAEIVELYGLEVVQTAQGEGWRVRQPNQVKARAHEQVQLRP